MGEKVFFTGASQTVPDGDKLVHGQQGEVTGPGTGDDGDKRVNVRFPGNKDSVNCLLTTVRRLRAASAATPRAPAPNTHATLPTPRASPRQPLPRRPSPYCTCSRAHRRAHCPGA